MENAGIENANSQGSKRDTAGRQKLSLFTSAVLQPSNQSISAVPQTPNPVSGKPFASLYERTLILIAKLYNLPDFEYYLFPEGLDALMKGRNSPLVDPVSILWGCFRLGAPLCHLFNQLQPQTILSVPDISNVVVYTNVCKKCIFQFLVGVKEELGKGDEQLFSISEVYKDDTNGLVKVINVVDMVLEELEIRGLSPPVTKKFPFALVSSSGTPQDNRSKAIAELLSTERNYIESLQELMVYKQDLESKNVLSNDHIHAMFANLPELLDFQRRFLFSLEATLALPPKEQHIGAIFIQYEEGFQVYNAMCASYSNAINIAVGNQDRMAGIGLIDPVRGLQGYLIKPVQRICRYPLMLKEISKLSFPESYPFCDELKEAQVVMKRVTDNVNEVQRMEENKVLKVSLLASIDDLQGLSASNWGDLLLCDRFPMTAQNVEQIYHIYLFETVILCCKDIVKDVGKSRKSIGSKLDITRFEIKGKIYATSIYDVQDFSDVEAGKFELKVFWNDGEESFILKCRNLEQVQLWRERIIACSSGNTNNYKFGRGRTTSENTSDRRSSFRRTIQSVNANMFTESSRRGSMDSIIDTRTISLPVPTRRTIRNGAVINPRVSSIYVPAQKILEKGKYDTISEPIREELPKYEPIVPMPTSALPKPPNAALPLLPIISFPPPPTKSLPSPPKISPPLPLPPSASLPEPPKSYPPPTSALPQPPSLFSLPFESQLIPTIIPAALPAPIKPEAAVVESAVRNSQKTSTTNLIKMKIHYGELLFILAIPAYGAKFDAILEKVERKIKICGAIMPQGRRIILKYENDSNEFTIINNDLDIETAFDTARQKVDKGSITFRAE